MSQLQSDLRGVFGFSKQNAAIVEKLWKNKRLPIEFVGIVEHLFNHPCTKINTMNPRVGPFEEFNKLNYLISTGEIKC